MSDVEMRNKLFEIILEIDRLSVKKDYDGLRILHYSNCNWLQSVGLNEDYYNYLFENEIKPSMLIDSQPTVEVPQWIPCSERLPEDLNDKNIDCFLVTDGFLIWMAYYNSEIGWQFAECTNSRNKIDWTEIIAWQPLPQPYKGE